MNACVVGSSAMEHLLDRWSPRVVGAEHTENDEPAKPGVGDERLCSEPQLNVPCSQT